MEDFQKEWEHMWTSAESLFNEAVALIDEGVKTATASLPALVEHYRGQERLFRYPEENVNVALALKLVQLRGNIYAAKLLIDNGLYLEWDIVLRSIQESIEDIGFLVWSEPRESDVLKRYLESFFDEDLNRDGEPKERRSGKNIQRPEVGAVLGQVIGNLNRTESQTEFEETSRILHRVRSGSVHGRAASIMRAFLDESVSGVGQLCLEGKFSSSRVSSEYKVLFNAIGLSVSVYFAAGKNRWWDEEFVSRALHLRNRIKVVEDDMDRF